MSYRNPLHTGPIPSTPYTSLGRAPAPAPSQDQAPSQAKAPSQPQSGQSNPRLLRLPMDTKFSSKRSNQVGRTSGVKPTTFDWKGRQPGEGVKMVELAMRGYEQLAHELIGGHDLVFKPGVTKITLYIIWPGYTHVDWCRSIEVNTRYGPMTRAQLGNAIASMFMRYIDKTQYETCSAPQWRVGTNGITINNLVLLSAWNPFENAWQAEVAIEL